MVEAVNRSDDLQLPFDATKETYASPSMNYYVESLAVLYLAHSRGLLTRMHLLVTGLWRQMEAAGPGEWRSVFATLFGCTPHEFYDELAAFRAKPRSAQMEIVPDPLANVLASCCEESAREACGLCAIPGYEPRTGQRRNEPGAVYVTANLGVRGSDVGVVLTTT